MKLNFTFRHLDHSDSLQNYLQDQIDRVGIFLLKEGAGQVEISKNKKVFCIEVSISTRQRFFKATAEHFDVYSAVDEVVTRLERQFLKVNKVNKSHKKYELSKSAQLEMMTAQFEPRVRQRKAA